MLRMRASFSLIARVYEPLVAHKEVTPRKGFGADVAYKSKKVRLRLKEYCEKDADGFSFVCVRM